MRISSARFRALVFAAWAILIGGGVVLLDWHAATPGPAAGSIAPLASADRVVGKPTLIMFVHPKCACTDASFEELSVLLNRCGKRVRPIVYCFVPVDDRQRDWPGAESLSEQKKADGVEFRDDPDAALARQYGAQTSGQIFLFDSDGNLLYSGGLTGSRGHVGENVDLTTVTRLILDPASRSPSPIRGRAFGCAIYPTTATSSSTSEAP